MFILTLFTMIGFVTATFSAKADENAESAEAVSMATEDKVMESSRPFASDAIWKHQKKKFLLGFTTATLDQKSRFGGEISSRWGAFFKTGYNINLHPKPIGGFVKIGLNLDLEMNYINFAKGTGSLSDMMHPEDLGDDEEMPFSLGRHYLTAGLAIGPNVTFAPFYKSSNYNLASLRFRPYFHVVPSFATYIVSDEEDMDFHNAFAFWCAAGLEIQWRRLIVGFEWKGSTAKYKGVVDNLIGSMLEGETSSESYKFDVNMFNIAIGFGF